MNAPEKHIELLEVDPFYAHAVEAVDSIMEHGFTAEQIATKSRAHIQRYRSTTNRVRFMDGFRSELTAFINKHRKICTRERSACPQENDYATAITIVRDELEVLNPAIAARSEASSFQLVEVNEVTALLNDLKVQLKTVSSKVEVIQLSEKFSYDDIIELLEDMNNKLPYGKPDWYDLFKARLGNVAMDETLRSTIVEPALNKLRAMLMN